MNHEEKVRARARQLWEEQGKLDGRDEQYWLEAERQIRHEAAERGSQEAAEGTASSQEPLVDTTLDTASPRSRKSRTRNGSANRVGDKAPRN
jgi:hypothetical protein